MDILQNIPLAPFTTFGIGGPARWFVEARTEDEIAESTEWARKRGIALFVLGGGSNVLIADAGFDGLVLHVALRGIATRIESPPIDGILSAAAGEPWEECVSQSAARLWAGLECLSGIPGTVGGTPVQNVGAYGQEVASVIDQVRAFDLNDRRFVEFTAKECGFSYRHSRFNTSDRGRFIVTRVDYRLKPMGKPTLRYADLEREFEAWKAEGSMPTLSEVARAVRRIRQSKGMLLVNGDPDCRSAGSFFKNPVIAEAHYQQIAARSMQAPPRYPAGPGAEDRNRVKVPAAWLIEHAGFGKGYALGAAGISSRHTLALINRGGASAESILALADEIAAAVEDRYSIRLEREPVLVGFQ